MSCGCDGSKKCKADETKKTKPKEKQVYDTAIANNKKCEAAKDKDACDPKIGCKMIAKAEQAVEAEMKCLCTKPELKCGTDKKMCDKHLTKPTCDKDSKKGGCHWATADGAINCFKQGELKQPAGAAHKATGTVFSCGKSRDDHTQIKIENFTYDGTGKLYIL
jgi:hypothetical protein